MPTDIEPFVAAMAVHVPPEARMLFCQFRGDPNDDIQGKWRARALTPDRTDRLDGNANVYVCVSAMKKNDRGELRRRKENFAGGLLMMIDDIGSGPGSKFPMSVLDPLPPSALIETSPDNFQAVYLFDELLIDMAKFDALIRAFIARQFLSADTGMAGVNRVFRPPIGVNGKAKYFREGKPWTVRAAEMNLDRRYTVEQITAAFDLTLEKQRARPRRWQDPAQNAQRIRYFLDLFNALREMEMVKSEIEDQAGWLPITCPWVEGHTACADTGAAIRIPAVENDWWGAFRCHHGHCEGRGIRAVSDWLNDGHIEELERINREWSITS